MMCCFPPFYAPRSFLSLSRAPSPSSLTRLSRRQSQRETFLPRSSSLSHGFVQLAPLTGSPAEERRGGGNGPKTSASPPGEGRKAWWGFRERIEVCLWTGSTLIQLVLRDQNDAVVTMLQQSPLPCCQSWYGLVWSQLVGRWGVL